MKNKNNNIKLIFEIAIIKKAITVQKIVSYGGVKEMKYSDKYGRYKEVINDEI